MNRVQVICDSLDGAEPESFVAELPFHQVKQMQVNMEVCRGQSVVFSVQLDKANLRPTKGRLIWT